MTGKLKRLGIFGGTFNPVHMGHLRAAEEIAECFSLDEVHFYPAAQPPHKSHQIDVDFHHRQAMLDLAVANRCGFLVSDLEERLPKPSYTINTLRAVSRLHKGQAELFFMVGYDSFRSIGKWNDYKNLFRTMSFLVFRRPGTKGSLKDMGGLLSEILTEKISQIDGDKSTCFEIPGLKPVYYYEGCRLAISSTDLRIRLAAGSSVRYLVPEPVREYIAEHKFYLEK